MAEPVIGAGGVITPPETYFDKVGTYQFFLTKFYSEFLIQLNRTLGTGASCIEEI